MTESKTPYDGDAEPEPTPVPVPPYEDAPSSTGLVVEEDEEGTE